MTLKKKKFMWYKWASKKAYEFAKRYWNVIMCSYPVTELFSRILMQWSKFFACVLVTGEKYGIILAVLVIQCLWDKPDSVPLIQTPIPFFPLSLSLLFKEIFKRCQETKKKHKPIAVPIFLIILQKLGRHSASPLLTLSHFSSHKYLT